MDRGAKALARILLLALVMGLTIVGFHPDYRETLGALRRGQPESSPIWLSNQAYYPEVTLGQAVTNHVAD